MAKKPAPEEAASDCPEAAPDGRHSRVRMAGAFQPFANASNVRTLGSLTVENGSGGVSVHGHLDIACDQVGLRRARALKAVVDAVVATLEQREATGDLPTAASDDPAPPTVKNPFI